MAKVGAEEMEVAKRIGAQFCEQYYNLFDTNRAGLAPLYTDVSQMSFEGDTKVGTTAITEKIVSLPFKAVKHIATAIDCQPTLDGSILITVLGQVKTDDDPPNSFHQSFLLKESGGNYFVLNEIFRLGLHHF